MHLEKIMKILILFREGLSGHYLKALIDDYPGEIGFRVDPWYPGIYSSSYINPRSSTAGDCCCMHTKDVDVQTALARHDLVLSIQVHRRIYHGIYNNFHKKLLVEQLDLRERFLQWQLEPGFWYDIAFYNLQEYYGLFRKDRAANMINDVVDFDLILEIDYIEKIFQKYLRRSINLNTHRLVASYRAQQLQYDLSGDEKHMKDIVAAIPNNEFHRSPWFAAYCIFKYEINNGLQEERRQWSINEIDRLIDKTTLIDIASKYG